MKKNFGKNLARNANIVILIVVVVAISVVLNLLLELFPLNIDLTAEKLYSLTEITEEVLDGLEDDVTIYALYDRIEGESDTYQSQVIKVLDYYDNYSHVNIEYVNLDRKPAFLRELVGESNVSLYSAGDYIVQHGDNIRRIDGDDITETEIVYDSYYPYEVTTGLVIETKLTSSILKVFSDVPIIYYSTGFGELSQSYFSTMLSYIDSSGFDVKEIDLKTENFDENAAAVMFFGPTQDLTGEAADKLDRWLMSGGDAFFFMDALELDNNDAPIQTEFANFSEVLSKYGVIIGDSIVEESDEYAVGSDHRAFYTETVSAGAFENMTSSKFYVLNSRTLDVDTMIDMAEPEIIMMSSSSSKAVSLLASDRSSDGKKSIGVTSKYTGGSAVSRVAVFGSSQSFYDTFVEFQGSTVPQTILRYVIEWMGLEASSNVGDSIAAKEYNTGTSHVDVTEQQTKWIALSVTVAIPVVILAVGVIIWLRRRHL